MKGFSLLFAVLIVGIVLAISIGISDLVTRESALSGFGRDSQMAFFAADSGVECALYWDIKGNAFATTSQSTINCAGLNLLVGGSDTSTFRLDFPDNGACVNVIVDKTTAYPLTKISSSGYNTCDPNNPRRVERTLNSSY